MMHVVNASTAMNAENCWAAGFDTTEYRSDSSYLWRTFKCSISKPIWHNHQVHFVVCTEYENVITIVDSTIKLQKLTLTALTECYKVFFLEILFRCWHKISHVIDVIALSVRSRNVVKQIKSFYDKSNCLPMILLETRGVNAFNTSSFKSRKSVYDNNQSFTLHTVEIKCK